MKKEDRNFEKVIEAIKNAEIDVDRVLEAAKLQRNEQQSRKLTAEQKASVIETVALILGLLTFFVIMMLPILLGR